MPVVVSWSCCGWNMIKVNVICLGNKSWNKHIGVVYLSKPERYASLFR